MTIVADTGALYALIDSSDSWHERVTSRWGSNSSPIVVPATVLPELCYLLQTRIGTSAEMAFIQAVADEEFTIEPTDAENFERIASLMDVYTDLPLGFVDASVIASAERLETRNILTTDRRHFSVVRPRHAKSLVLLP